MVELEKEKNIDKFKKPKTIIQKVIGFIKGAVIAFLVYMVLGMMFQSLIMGKGYDEYIDLKSDYTAKELELKELKENGLDNLKQEVDKELQDAKNAKDKASKEYEEDKKFVNN